MGKNQRIKNNQWKKLNSYLDRNGISYQQYLKGEHWQDVRRRYWKSKLHNGGCYVCERTNVQLQLHHKTYKRVGNERLNDLLLLCGDCHKAAHELEKSDWIGILYGAAKRLRKNFKTGLYCPQRKETR